MAVFKLYLLKKSKFQNEAIYLIYYSKCSSFKSKRGMKKFQFDRVHIITSKLYNQEITYPDSPDPLSSLDFGKLIPILRVYGHKITFE